MILSFRRRVLGFVTTRQFFLFDSKAREADSTKTDEDEAQDDKDAKHVLLGHDEHQTELDHIEAGVETVLDTAKHPSLAFLHILLDDLSDRQVSNPQSEPRGDNSRQHHGYRGYVQPQILITTLGLNGISNISMTGGVETILRNIFRIKWRSRKPHRDYAE